MLVPAAMPSHRPLVVALLAAIAAVAPVDAARRQPKARASMDLQVQADHDARRGQRVIIRYRAGAGDRLRQRLAVGGNRVEGHQRRGRTLAARIKPGDLTRLALDADVVGISVDARVTVAQGLRVLSARTVKSRTGRDAQALRRTLGLPATPAGGRGIGVAIIDSGIAPVPDIAGRITAFYDFTRGGVPAAPSDEYGHGTLVAGLIAGSGVLSAGRYVGIAPAVRLIGLKVLDAQGSGHASDVLKAIDHAIAHRDLLGIDVINLSLGHPVYEPAATDPLVQAVERASAAGIIVVASAGNFGRARDSGKVGFGGIASPGSAPSAITVGALRTRDTVDRSDDSVSPDSSRGPTWYDGLSKPDVAAPGVDLVAAANPGSTLARRQASRTRATGYLRLSGTSLAAAVTSGVVALVLEAGRARGEAPDVRLSPNAVKALLQYSALAVVPHDAEAPVELESGAGALNAAGAIALASAIDPVAPRGGHWLDAGFQAATDVGGRQWAWGQRVVWGDRIVWGESVTRHEAAWDTVTWGAAVTWTDAVLVEATSLVTDSIDVWGPRAIFGSGRVHATGDDHIVWGNIDGGDDHIVWGNGQGTDDDDHIVWGTSVGPPAPLTPSVPES